MPRGASAQHTPTTIRGFKSYAKDWRLMDNLRLRQQYSLCPNSSGLTLLLSHSTQLEQEDNGVSGLENDRQYPTEPEVERLRTIHESTTRMAANHAQPGQV
jgi:hypothetical protein